MNALTPDEKILQLLNRITFGPRPGDVERVRQMGIARFLDQQLHPERIDDSAVESKVAALTTISLSTEELAEDFEEMRADRRAQLGGAAGQNATAGAKPGAKPDSAAQPAARPAPLADAPGPSADLASFLDLLKPADRGASAASADRPNAGAVGSAAAGSPSKASSAEARATAMNSKSMEGETSAPAGTMQTLPLPRRVIVELAQEEVLRAVYSQRQLQEVMVQFWMNHFKSSLPRARTNG